MTQMVELNQFHQKAKQVKTRVPTILSQWGLPPKFNRWRLAQDPDSGMVVLFAMLNTRYIATHTAAPFSDYFDPRLLNDLANDLHMQVVSCNSDGLRYAFIMDRGQIDKLPTHVDFPFLDGDRLFIRVVYDDKPVQEMAESRRMPEPLIADNLVDDTTLVYRGVGAFLKVFDDINLKGEAASILTTQGQPNIVVIKQEDFEKRVVDHKANLQRTSHIRRLFDKSAH